MKILVNLHSLGHFHFAAVLIAHNGFRFDFPLMYNEIARRTPVLSPDIMKGIFFADSLDYLRQVKKIQYLVGKSCFPSLTKL